MLVFDLTALSVAAWLLACFLACLDLVRVTLICSFIKILQQDTYWEIVTYRRLLQQAQYLNTVPGNHITFATSTVPEYSSRKSYHFTLWE